MVIVMLLTEPLLCLKVVVPLYHRKITMAKLHFRSYITNQIILFPQRIDENIAENDPVRIVSSIVDHLDLSSVNKLYNGILLLIFGVLIHPHFSIYHYPQNVVGKCLLWQTFTYYPILFNFNNELYIYIDFKPTNNN